mmetsp:Transcript_13571/g.28343  ORF Transcript_13571/g.28343 Transcript_13571/m.28343 type:complete len:666 (+) Transcript_13571:1-1998(+)
MCAPKAVHPRTKTPDGGVAAVCSKAPAVDCVQVNLPGLDALRLASHADATRDCNIGVKLAGIGFTVDSPTHSEAETISTTPAASIRLCEEEQPRSLAEAITPEECCSFDAGDASPPPPQNLVHYPCHAISDQRMQLLPAATPIPCRSGYPSTGTAFAGSKRKVGSLGMGSSSGEAPRLSSAAGGLGQQSQAHDEPALLQQHSSAATPSPSLNTPYPDVHVTLATRMLLLRWARWGRNSWRIRQEEKIKALQHTRHPKLPSTPVVSPQPTPRMDIKPPLREKPSEQARSAQLTSSQASLWSSGSPHSSHRAAPSVKLSSSGNSRCSSGRTHSGPNGRLWVDEMMQEQRDSMREQGLRLKLSSKLGSSAAQAKSAGTPGFGVETPNFAMANSRMSASAEASIVSSGVASPLAEGQLSPWILEAEALVNEDDGGIVESPMAWGPGSCLGQIPEASGLDASPGSMGTLEEDTSPIEDEDELDKVSALVAAICDDAPTTAGCASPSSREDLSSRARAEHHPEPSSRARTAAPSRPPPPAPEARRRGRRRPEYEVGQAVSYWSDSHCSWMPAQIVERRSRSVYLIDKQISGCYSKIHVSNLRAEAEERGDRVSRAFRALEQDVQPQPSDFTRAKTVSAKLPTGSVKAKNLAVTPKLRGQIVRDDFSDDSDD